MNDQIEIKDLDQGVPVQEDWLVFQKVSDGVVYKAPKSDIEGEDAFVYIAYADDDIGTGFTLTFDANKDYIAIKSTNTEIANPVVGDFAGLWKKYKGEKGDTGDNATVDVRTTTTLAPGQPATVTNVGTTQNAVFDFAIPQGEKGDKGDRGDKGEKGATGDRGLTGPQGEQGPRGEQGPQGVAGNDGTDGISFIWKDVYDNGTTYQANDVVSYLGSSYICILESTGNLPTNTTYWSLMAQKGLDGAGAGDMLASVYDPTSIKSDAFDMDKMVEGTNNKLVSSAEKTAWNNKLDDITGESIADLSDVDSIAGITDGKVLKWDTGKFVVADDDNTTYTASDFDIKNLTDSTDLRTTWNDKLDDITGESIADLSDVDSIAGITDGKVLKWSTDKFIVADDNDTTYTASDFDIKDLTDSTSLLAGKEDTTNKVTSFQGTPDNSHYPSEKLTYDQLALKASLTEAETITNKRITPRVLTITSSATPTINTDNYDAVTITALAEAIYFTTNLSGTPTNFQKLIIRIKDNGTARAITWGDSFEAKGVALPTTTVISKVLTVGFIYDTVTSKWGCVAVAQE